MRDGSRMSGDARVARQVSRRFSQAFLTFLTTRHTFDALHHFFSYIFCYGAGKLHAAEGCLRWLWWAQSVKT